MAATAARAASRRWLDLGEQQRAAVARAAVDLVLEGATPLRVADLAARARISRPTFYKYFPTLGAAVLHTLRTLLVDLDAFVTARDPAGENGRERLLARFSSGFEYSRAHPELTRFFSFYDHSFRASGFGGDEEAADRRAFSAVAGDPFLDLFRLGRADGSIDPELPAEVTYLLLVTSMAGTNQRLLVEQEWTSGTDPIARQVHEALVDLWRTRLTPKETK